MRLEQKHYVIIAMLIGGIAAQLSTVKDWSSVLQPGFIGGMLATMASTITALFTGKPGAEAELARANKNTDMANESTKAALSQPMDTTKVDPKRYLGPEDLDIG